MAEKNNNDMKAALRATNRHGVIRPMLGLSDEQREGVYRVLAHVLADTFTIRTKVHKYHWNIVGPEFHALHELFEKQYNALGETLDELAERIRSYGYYSPGTMAEFSELKTLEEDPGMWPSAHDMVANLVSDHETIIRSLREKVEVVGEEYKDVGSEDYLTALLQAHQDMAWMLRAFLEGRSVLDDGKDNGNKPRT